MLLLKLTRCKCFSAETAKDGNRDEISAGHSDASFASGETLKKERCPL